MNCYCSHPVDFHSHYRAGSDCSLCDCRKVRTEPTLFVLILQCLLGLGVAYLCLLFILAIGNA